MENLELAKEFLSSIEQKNFDRVEELIDEQFSFRGPVPEPTDKKGFLEMHRALLAGLSNFKYNATDLKAEGDVVTGNIEITAKHTATLDLSFMDGPVVEATQKEIKLPKEAFTSRIKESKVIEITSETPEDGGLRAILKQIGAEIPEQQAARY